MAGRGWGCCLVILGSVLVIAVGNSAAQAPEGVSPGAPDRILEVEGRCPSFYWGGVPEAAAYELVVYRLPDEQAASGAAEIELSPTDQVLYAELPAGATAWQPGLGQALTPGVEYVWFVRAVIDAETREASAWSAGRYFEVAAPQSAQEVEQALEVLQRWQAANGHGSMAPSSAAAAATAAAAVTDPGSGTGTRTGSSRPKSVPTATAAIRGSVPDATGEVYGVVGISASPDGAGVAAANAGGGPDLVLDGSLDGFADAHLSEQGIDRPSAGARTFFLTNSIGGTLNLSVAGEVSAVSLAGDGGGLTGVDADSLDGTDGADYATDAEAAGLVALHAASADHDGRYYTKTQLNTSGAGGALHWNNLTAVPAGFADGIDNDTQYTVGPGIIIDGGEIRIDWSLLHTRTSTLDSVDWVGEYTSIAIGADGLGLISYYDNTNGDLKVAHCNDAACSSATTATLDSAGDVGLFTSIAIGADGLGLISYFDSTDGDLKVAHCSDTECSGASTTTLDSVGMVGGHNSIAIGVDGLGLISYVGLSPDQLKIAHCNDVLCASASISVLDNVWVRATGVAIGADGLGLISYTDETGADLKIAHCNNVLCTGATTSTLDSAASVGWWVSGAIGVDGLGLISYAGDQQLKVARCDNLDCTSATLNTVDSVGMVGAANSVTIGSDGLGLISYLDSTNADLKVAHCNDTICSSATTAPVDVLGMVGSYTSIAIGADGLGLISYYDQTNGDLKVAHLGIGVP